MKMKKNMIQETLCCKADLHEYLKSVCLLLADYASNMLSAGATSHIIEDSIRKIAKAYDVETELSILPRRVLVVVYSDGHNHSYTTVGKTIRWGINLAVICALSRLAGKLEQERVSVAEAAEKMEAASAVGSSSRWFTLLSVACANASFCKLFGGDFAAMAIVFFATLDGFYIKQRLLGWRVDGRIVVFVSSLFASIIGASGIIFQIGDTPDIALGTSVLFLVPGIPFINAMSDMLHGHHLCAMSRLTEAVIATVCLSLGLCAALQLTRIGWS